MDSKLQTKTPAEFFAENRNIAGFDNVRAYRARRDAREFRSCAAHMHGRGDCVACTRARAAALRARDAPAGALQCRTPRGASSAPLLRYTRALTRSRHGVVRRMASACTPRFASSWRTRWTRRRPSACCRRSASPCARPAARCSALAESRECPLGSALTPPRGPQRGDLGGCVRQHGGAGAAGAHRRSAV
jgi:hypothetical protein